MQGWGLGSYPGGCSHCPAAPGMVQPLWTSSSDEEKEMLPQRGHTENRTAPRIPQQHPGRAAQTSPAPSSKEGTTSVYRQSHHPAVPLRTGWGWSPVAVRNT